MAVSSRNLCKVCDYSNAITVNHNNTATHQLNVKKWEWKNYRKALVKDRHGIIFSIEPLSNNAFLCYNYDKKRGNHKVKILPNHLQMLGNTLRFMCKITNTSNHSILIPSIQLLIPEALLTISSDKDYFKDGHYIELKPRAMHKFELVFKTEESVASSYKRQIACNFQTEAGVVFTIARALVIDISSGDHEVLPNAPFSDSKWNNVKHYIKPIQKKKYSNQYAIPTVYRNILIMGLQEFKDMSSEDSEILQRIKKNLGNGLSLTNYSSYFHTVLWLDEIAQEMMLQRYNMDNVNMEIKNEKILVLTVPGLAERRPSIIVGDIVRIRLHNDYKAYEGYVKRVNEKTIDIEYIDDELFSYIKLYSNSNEFDVSFKLGRLPYERMHKGVDQVFSNGIAACLFDSVSLNKKNQITHILHDTEFYNPLILENIEQKTAVIKILNCSSQKAPYIVFGPPGTGKTITIVEAILQILKKTKKRILVCAPANSACDMIALKLMPHCTKSELIRIHSDTRDISSISKEVMNYSNMNNGIFKKIPPEECMMYRIVVTTLVLIGRYQYNYKPDCLFIDEAAQACEPEAAIAMGLLKFNNKQLVLAGDPKQLGPICSSRLAADKYGLGISLLERLMSNKLYKGFDSNFITMLKLNFRSHPVILHLPNKLFYENQLKAFSDSARNDPLGNVAIHPRIYKKKGFQNCPGQSIEFCSVSEKEKRDGNSPSYYNPAEVDVVEKYVRTLLNLDLEPNYKVTQQQIGIVTPYVRQVFKIRFTLTKNNFNEVEVGTTESFQGREKRIIIISTVRAQNNLLLYDRKYNLGFVRNDKRFNVAVTRAMSKLIIIGCPRVLETDNKWQSYMELCETFNVFYGAPYSKRTKDVTQEILRRIDNVKFHDPQYKKNRKL